MELAKAIEQLVAFQLQIPNPRKPLELLAHCTAEVFLVETICGPALGCADRSTHRLTTYPDSLPLL